jgi:hypothetical protein
LIEPDLIRDFTRARRGGLGKAPRPIPDPSSPRLQLDLV